MLPPEGRYLVGGGERSIGGPGHVGHGKIAGDEKKDKAGRCQSNAGTGKKGSPLGRPDDPVLPLDCTHYGGKQRVEGEAEGQ